MPKAHSGMQREEGSSQWQPTSAVQAEVVFLVSQKVVQSIVGATVGAPVGSDVGTDDSVGESVGAAEMVGAAVVGMGVGWQAPSVFLTPQVPPLAPVLRMQGE